MHKLRMIRGDFFPGLVGAQDPLADTVMEKQVVEIMEELNTCVIPGMTGLECQVRPHHAEKIDYSEMCTFDEELAVREFLKGSKISDPGERGDPWSPSWGQGAACPASTRM